MSEGCAGTGGGGGGGGEGRVGRLPHAGASRAMRAKEHPELQHLGSNVSPPAHRNPCAPTLAARRAQAGRQAAASASHVMSVIAIAQPRLVDLDRTGPLPLLLSAIPSLKLHI
eukprot:COSAG01_NODE_2406_length_7755_cov_316.703892_7_plen_113_part_00